MLSKKLMILGASSLQLPGIRKAVDLGHYVMTVDYLPENVGHQISHHYVPCSTIDRDCVLQAAQELQIDGICTFSSDVAVPTVGYVCERMGLPGVSIWAAETMATKHRFRSFQQKHRFEHPHFIEARSFEEVANGLPELKFPVVFKPVDTSGSRGIVKLSIQDPVRVKAAFHYAQNFSRSGTVCIEEFVRGTNVSGDGILVDGHFAFIAITHKHLDGFVVTGHSLPTNISQTEQQQVIATLESCCQALDYRNGPLNFDVIVAPEKVTIIEMSPRNGGNGIAAIIERATGVDVEVATLKLALGESISFPPIERWRGCGSFIFGSTSEGTLDSISDREQLCREIPDVFALHLAVQPGNKVLPFEHNGNMLGYALFDCEDYENYRRIGEKILKALQIDVIEGK